MNPNTPKGHEGSNPKVIAQRLGAFLSGIQLMAQEATQGQMTMDEYDEEILARIASLAESLSDALEDGHFNPWHLANGFGHGFIPTQLKPYLVNHNPRPEATILIEASITSGLKVTLCPAVKGPEDKKEKPIPSDLLDLWED